METLYTNPPEQRAVICLDQMGPVAAKSYPGPQLVGAKRAAEPPAPAPRATQEMDDGRRGKGDICGAFRPATGAALTQDYLGRTIHNWVGFLGHVEAWVPAEIERLDAIVDHLHGHRATDVLLFCLPHPRWEFVLQPKYAASLNLIEPWWKTLRSLALTGRRFATWAEVVKAIEGATVYGNNHRHPYIWGRRRRHRPRRKAGIAALPKAAETCRMHHLAFGFQRGRNTAPYTLTEDKTILQASGRCLAGIPDKPPTRHLQRLLCRKKFLIKPCESILSGKIVAYRDLSRKNFR